MDQSLDTSTTSRETSSLWTPLPREGTWLGPAVSGNASTVARREYFAGTSLWIYLASAPEITKACEGLATIVLWEDVVGHLNLDIRSDIVDRYYTFLFSIMQATFSPHPGHDDYPAQAAGGVDDSHHFVSVRRVHQISHKCSCTELSSPIGPSRAQT